jgi:hypothetical protein
VLCVDTGSAKMRLLAEVACRPQSQSYLERPGVAAGYFQQDVHLRALAAVPAPQAAGSLAVASSVEKVARTQDCCSIPPARS